MIGRVKQDPSIDDQQQQPQRSDMNDSKQLIYQSLMNKTSVNRLPSTATTTTYVQPTNQSQQWHTSVSQSQLNPPPNYTTATRPRHPTIIQQQGPNPPTSHTLLAPLRANPSTPPPPTYIARTSSTPNLARLPLNVTLARPSLFSSQQQQQQPQDPSPR